MNKNKLSKEDKQELRRRHDIANKVRECILNGQTVVVNASIIDGVLQCNNGGMIMNCIFRGIKIQ